MTPSQLRPGTTALSGLVLTYLHLYLAATASLHNLLVLVSLPVCLFPVACLSWLAVS